MTTPAPPPRTAPGPYPYQRGYWSLARILLVIGAILFTLAAFAAISTFADNDKKTD